MTMHKNMTQAMMGSTPTSPPSTFVPSNLETAIFGKPIELAVQRSAKIDAMVPDIVTKCVRYLLKKGLKEVGLFRVSGSANEVKELRESFDKGIPISNSRLLNLTNIRTRY